MHLSRLKLDPLRRSTHELCLSPYLLHHAAFRAFPDESDGGPDRVRYRLDVDHQGNTNLLVQSEKEPDWDKAALLKQCLLEPAACRQFSPEFRSGKTLYFQLRANPTVKKQTEGKKNGFRLGLFGKEDQLTWFRNKAEEGGFALVNCRVTLEGIVHDKKGSDDKKLSHYAVRFEGILEVNDPEAFLKTLECGIGPAKGFGFGLLSIAPVRSSKCAHCMSCLDSAIAGVTCTLRWDG